MDTYYFDWSHGKINVLKNEDTQDTVYRDLWQMLDAIPEPSIIIGEASFESFFRDSKRNQFIQDCEDRGHTLLTTANRATGKYKVKKYPPDQFPQFYGGNAKFPDDLAVDLIREIAQSGYHLKVPRRFDPDDLWLPVRQAACKELMILRNTKTPKMGKKGQFLTSLESGQDKLAREVLPFLVPYEDLPDRQHRSLGNGKHYSACLIATTAVAAKYVDSVRDFDKLSGLYGHGYPTQFRSNYHYYGMKYAIKRHGDTRQTRSDFRFSCRWLYHQLKTLT